MQIQQNGCNGLNPTMVRLKGAPGLTFDPNRAESQSHYGSIKSPNRF